MKRLLLTIACLGLLAVLPGQAQEARKLPAPAAGTMEFTRDIRPILERTCVRCHGAMQQKGGLRLDEGRAALQGGNSGKAIKPGDGAGSRLLQLAAGLDPELHMPPKGPGLTPAELSRLRAWIDQGARWPQTTEISTGPAVRSKHWAFQPIRRPALLAVKDRRWVRNGLDTFILARLEAEAIAPSPEADRATLLRRLRLDLVGLPPTPQEVEEFLHDDRPDAYERVVERLLASTHYGERWGRHWLDLARYADSDGFEKDSGRPFAWRYRDWVIQALNRDLPFDQFTIEQLAGDLLPGATLEQKVATGFHRNTLTNHEGGVDREQFRVEQVVDRVNTTARVFLGITLNCCQCHDHKYDPFTQREFYQLFAFFNSDVEVDLFAPVPGEEEVYQRRYIVFSKKKAELEAALAEHERELAGAQEKWEQALTPAERKKLKSATQALLAIKPEQRTTVQRKELAALYAKMKKDTKLAELTTALRAFEKTAPTPPSAQTLAIGKPRPTHVMIRGDFLRPGAEVQPGTPAVLPPLKTTTKPTRLDLARWLTDPANPLTARVTSNWVWQRYFGRGLVATLEDVGTQGERPSHPELLDWLASELVRRNWSLKDLHRLIVTSATYRQSSHAQPELVARDPLNVLLARQNRLRLEAEVVRDVALAASGLLTRRVGGPSVHPPQPAGISELTYAGSARWIEDTGPNRYRRGLYTWFQRTSPYPMLITFDAPDANLSCMRRERSDTPLQALTLLNDTVFLECAQALGRRTVMESYGSVMDRIRHAFYLSLGRTPTGPERAVLYQLYRELLALYQAQPAEAKKLVGALCPPRIDAAEAAAWVALARAIMNLDEFVTRE